MLTTATGAADDAATRFNALDYPLLLWPVS
jgi:hypothetical protein